MPEKNLKTEDGSTTPKIKAKKQAAAHTTLSDEAIEQAKATSERTAQEKIMTSEEIERILNIEERYHLKASGGMARTAIPDEKTGFVYYVEKSDTNPKGRLIGKRVRLTDELREHLKKRVKQEAYSYDDYANEAEEDADKPDTEDIYKPEPPKQEIATISKEPKKKQTKKRKGVFLKILVLGIVIVGTSALGYGFLRNKPIAVDIGSEKESIVQVVRDLIPGDVIELEDIKETVVSTETYNQITLQGINLYQWDKSENLVGMYVQNYIPQNQYLSYDNISATYEAARTLWKSDNALEIPLTEEELQKNMYLPGAKVDIVIRKSVTTENPVKTDKENEVGTTIQQNTTIKEYKVTNAIISDVRTKSETSLMYSSLFELSFVPAGEQPSYIMENIEKDGFLDRVSPSAIIVQVPADVQEELSDAKSDSLSYEIALTGEIDDSTEEKASFYAKAESLMTNMTEAKKLYEEQQKEEENNEK